MEIACKIVLKTFFFGEHLRLCPWPWPRASLFLASRGSVLGRAVLGLEPCVLDSTSGFNQVSNRTWTRTVNPNEPFHFGEPEPNLNQQNFTSVNPNQTWTLKIVLKWTQTEPEPLTKVRIYFSISGCRWRWYTHNKSSGDHQQDQQFLLFFSGRNE